MKLIVGLGNPGILYANTRHNAGFQVIKYLAKAEKIALKKEKGIPALSAKTRIEGKDVVLAMPLTFMNLSGEAVRQLINKYKVDSADLLVVCDDLDLEFGRIRIRPQGSSAGHRGVKSVINSLSSSEFARLRIGIGRPGTKAEVTDYVLSRFNQREKKEFANTISLAAECAMSWLSCDHNKMNNQESRI